MKEYKLFWKNYFNFKEKSSRKQYWIPRLINLAILLLITIVWIAYVYLLMGIVAKSSGVNNAVLVNNILINWLPWIFNLVTFIPTWSISIRRFRDVGIGWYWYLPFIIFEGLLLYFAYNYLMFLILALIIVLEIVLMCKPSNSMKKNIFFD